MESGNSKKSSAELAPSPKRLKMVESGATLDLQIGLTEQSEGQGIPPETPAQKVLRLPELVSIIFGHLAADSDLKSLKNSRAVCSLWRHEVFIALRSNLCLMPCIVVENPDSEDLSDSLKHPHCLWKSLESSMDSLLPGCGFPLKLAINQWSPQLESFIRDFSKDIVHFEIKGHYWFDGFPAELATIELPALKHASFSALEICSRELYLVEFGKVVKFWNKLVGASKKKKTEVRLEFSKDFDEDLSLDNAAFDQVEWSQVGTLRCSDDFFVQVSAANELSALNDLDLFSSPSLEDEPVKQISLAKAPNLTKLEVGDQVEWVLNHQMKKLERVFFPLGVTISGTQPPSKLLPNLKSIFLLEGYVEGRSFASLTRGGGVFEKAIDLALFEHLLSLEERIDEVAVQLCESFPNLTKLEWHCGNSADNLDADGNKKHSLLAAPVIFSRLEFLTTLALLGVLSSERELVELVTGITLENIPEEEASWPTVLVGNTHSVVNLKHLNSFHLGVDEEYVRIVPRHTRFLFAAAFRTMETLEELCFTNIILEDTSCTTEWQEMGRQITLD